MTPLPKQGLSARTCGVYSHMHPRARARKTRNEASSGCRPLVVVAGVRPLHLLRYPRTHTRAHTRRIEGRRPDKPEALLLRLSRFSFLSLDLLLPDCARRERDSCGGGGETGAKESCRADKTDVQPECSSTYNCAPTLARPAARAGPTDRQKTNAVGRRRRCRLGTRAWVL